MSDTETRPVWDFDIPEEMIRWIGANLIVSLKAGWQMTGADTSESWVDLVAENGETRKVKAEWYGQPSIWDYVELNKGGGHSIIKWTRHGERARDRIQQMIDFDEAHERDKAEYERLKAKFEGEGDV